MLGKIDKVKYIEYIDGAREKDFYKIFIIFLFGISSGIPFLLLLSTLSIWLIEEGITKTQIGLFAWVTVPYTLKFLIAPFLDKVKLFFLHGLLGQRRSWLVLIQIGLIFSLLLLSRTDPSSNIVPTVIFAFLVGFFSACQDILVEAYRIEILKIEKIGIGASSSVLGYRVGMLLSGAGAIYLASFFKSWYVSYSIMAGFVLIGLLTTLFAKEPERHSKTYANFVYSSFFDFFNKLLIVPVKDLVKLNNVIIIILFILSFKVADTVLNIMTMPFLLEIGFSKIEIANVAKTFGIFAMIFGGIFAGFFLNKKNLYKLLILCANFQLLASIMFILQAHVGNDLTFLFVTMGIENVTCGMGQVAIIAYLSSLCNRQYTATHYAILSSFASFVRVKFSSLSGILADHMSWFNFYVLVAILCIPSFLILFGCKNHFEKLVSCFKVKK